MYLVLLFAAAALLGDCRSANINKHMKMLSEIDNSIQPNGLQTEPSVFHKFLTIKHRPEPSYELKPGGVVHLLCEAIGSPAPSVRWFRNDVPVYEYDMESNEIIDSNPTSVARITSTLIVTRSSKHDVYTCLVTAGSQTERVSTLVYSLDGSNEISERSKLYPLVPRIVIWYKVYLEAMGNNIVLPCRAKGHPRPQITWWDNKGNPVKNDPRMQVLRSGELVISDLRWSDMGDFICQANNLFGVTTARTFVYPATPET